MSKYHSLFSLSQEIESKLVRRNPRGMRDVQHALRPGYYLRAAKQLMNCKENIIIGTGFPVSETFETDGPIGAIALYEALVAIGKKPILVCGDPLYSAISQRYRCFLLPIDDLTNAPTFTKNALAKLEPNLIISIERPGLSEHNSYFNMRGENISDKCASFDYFLELATCPTIAIGDGGNEIGMGNIAKALEMLNVVPSKTQCDELLIADISNWAAYGLIAFLSMWAERNLFSTFKPRDILSYLSELGSVDGITKLNELTEDGVCISHSEQLINELEKLCGLI